MTNNIEVEKAKFIAVKYIGISKKSKLEVKTKLKSKQFEDDVVDEVVKYLEDLKYINDEEYVKLYISQNISFEKYSIYEIKYKLKQKGIDYKNHDKHFDKLYKSNYEKKVIKRLKETKLKNLEEIQIKQYLYRRGFNIEED